MPAMVTGFLGIIPGQCPGIRALSCTKSRAGAFIIFRWIGMVQGSQKDTNADSYLRPSLNQLLRHLKKQEVGLYNCVNSVLGDVCFVKEIANIYPSLSLVANLRCGLWYAPNCSSTCYFKSTDGHYGNWGFSCTRLNLHTAQLAARERGCIIVDATRRGKTFPVRIESYLARSPPYFSNRLICHVTIIGMFML